MGLPIWGLFAGGFLAGWALNMPLDPTSRDESRRLADGNARLKARRTPPQKEPGASLRVTLLEPEAAEAALGASSERSIPGSREGQPTMPADPMTLAIACSAPVLAQGTTEAQVPPAPPAATPAPTAPAPAPAPAEAQSASPLTVTGQPGEVETAIPANPKEIIIPSEGPGVTRGEHQRVRLPPPGPGREAFIRDFIRVDPKANAPFVGTDFISAKEFYGKIGRPDLVAESDGRTRKRIWLMAAATAVAIGGVATGVVVLGAAEPQRPGLLANSTVSYNECVDRSQQTTLIGGLIIGTAIVVAGHPHLGLVTPEMVTASEETVRLATGTTGTSRFAAGRRRARSCRSSLDWPAGRFAHRADHLLAPASGPAGMDRGASLACGGRAARRPFGRGGQAKARPGCLPGVRGRRSAARPHFVSCWRRSRVSDAIAERSLG